MSTRPASTTVEYWRDREAFVVALLGRWPEPNTAVELHRALVVIRRAIARRSQGHSDGRRESE